MSASRSASSVRPTTRAVFRLFALLLAAAHCWAAIDSYSMNADGIHYLDIADAYARADWDTAINAVWSPLYSWVLALPLHLIEPPMRWEFATVQLLNFGIFLLALIGFEFLWSTLARVSSGEDGFLPLPPGIWWAIGYSIFVWASLVLIEIWAVTPDLLVCAIVCASAALIASIRAGRQSYAKFALVGALLGFGYLAKAVMFPIAFVFLLTTAIAAGTSRRARAGSVVALVAFIIVAGPFLTLISISKGRLTFGEAGKITYAKLVHGAPYPHWERDVESLGRPIHPTRRAHDLLPIYEFAEPIGGTYPPGHDPSYWYEGVDVPFTPHRQFRSIVNGLAFYARRLIHDQGGLLFALLVLNALARRRLSRAGWIRAHCLMLPAIAAFALYALVLVEGRYIGPFVLLFWADLFGNSRFSASDARRKLGAFASIVGVAFTIVTIGLANFEGWSAVTARHSGDEKPQVATARAPSWPGEIVELAASLGLERGARVAVIGYGFDAYWARLGRYKIVAELYPWQADPFWSAVGEERSSYLDAFRSSRADALIAESLPSSANKRGWTQLGETTFHILFFDRPEE